VSATASTATTPEAIRSGVFWFLAMLAAARKGRGAVVVVLYGIGLACE
jgi:hypothetical protein